MRSAIKKVIVKNAGRPYPLIKRGHTLACRPEVDNEVEEAVASGILQDLIIGIYLALLWLHWLRFPSSSLSVIAALQRKTRKQERNS